MIYMDNAATTLRKPDCVIEAVVKAMTTMGNAGRGVNTASLDAARTLYETRVKLAQLFSVEDPSRIAFTSNSTESLNIAIQGMLQVGDHVITTALEHNSVLRPLYKIEEQGVELTIIQSNEEGTLRYEDFEKAMQSNTKAIVCIHGSNLTGNVVDIKKVGEIARKNNVRMIVDASQTAGVMNIDVEDMNIDILCFTGHKGLLGPQGTGGIYVKEGVELGSLKVGGSGVDSYNKNHPCKMPEMLEAGTANGHGNAGLLAALTYIEAVGIDEIRRKEAERMWQFYRGVKEIPGVKVYGVFEEEKQTERCAIVSLNIGAYDSAEVSDALLMDYGIATRSGAHCAPLMHEALGTKDQGAVRFSFSHYNTYEEVEEVIRAIQELSV